MAYSKELKQKARDMYMLHGNMSKLTEYDGLPDNRVSLHNWARDGICNDGVPWQDTFTKLQKEAKVQETELVLEEEIKETREFVKQTEGQLQDIISRLLREAKEGNLDASMRDIKQMYELLLMIGDTEYEALEFIKNVVRRIGSIVNKYSRMFMNDKDAKEFNKQVGLELREVLNEERKKFITLMNQ